MRALIATHPSTLAEGAKGKKKTIKYGYSEEAGWGEERGGPDREVGGEGKRVRPTGKSAGKGGP